MGLWAFSVRYSELQLHCIVNGHSATVNVSVWVLHVRYYSESLIMDFNRPLRNTMLHHDGCVGVASTITS